MLDLSVLSIFDPVSLSSTKNSSGEGISFELKLDPFLKSGSQNAGKLAKIIEQEAAKSKDEAKKLELIERSLAYIRAQGGNDLSSKVYDNLKDEDRTNGFIDGFGTADKVPSSVQSNPSAKTAWDKIMTGRAYDHIEENKNSITQDLESARDEADDKKILKVADNPALVNLKEELMENGMSGKEADKDISRMLRETNLLSSGESVEIEMDSPSSALSAGRTKKLEEFRDELTAKINKATSPEAAKKILEQSVDDFEALRPSGIKPETFYTEQMQAVLNESKNYNAYHVAAIPSLEKITVDGKELIKTTHDQVYVNSAGKFVNSKGEKYEVEDDKITVGNTKIDIEDIKPSQPEISVFMDKDSDTVEDKSLASMKGYIKDQKLVYEANGDEQALRELKKTEKVLGKSEDALNARREKEEKEGKSDNNDTLQLIVGIIGAAATIVAALSQGRGKTTTVTGGCGYNCQAGYGYGSYSDKYGYNRGYQATVDAAYQRSNQYLSTLYNNPVRTRASIMRQNGMYAIQNGAGIHRYTG
ncbi:MAG: hypothetical protein VKK32_00555 [Candidatus Melainabacteria bacterium]|nr:hypothetical protein [Candidatus Melainabacteria bacterium]